MVAMAPDAPSAPGAPGAAPPGVNEVQRQARYNHLIGRLHTRQITMEEATELFALMQAMLRASEVARRSAAQATAASAGPAPSVARVLRGTPSASAGADDLFLVGLLAMGAGAGLLAAMARRMAEPPATPPPAQQGTSSRRDA